MSLMSLRQVASNVATMTLLKLVAYCCFIVTFSCQLLHLLLLHCYVLQLQNGLVKVQKLVGRLAIGWVKWVFMACNCYFPAE